MSIRHTLQQVSRLYNPCPTPNLQTHLTTPPRNNLWWQSGNILETIAKLGSLDPSFTPTATAIISNTYTKSPNQAGAQNWKNDFYDDMGWWAMAWIASYDLTRDPKYLATAQDLFEDMTGGWNTPCGGGIWWDKKRTAVAAISNELFLSVAASLANRVPGANWKQYYVDWAQMEWDWFWESGLVNGEGLVNDGLDVETCLNNQKWTFTYNQGVVLAGLSELAKAKSDGGFVEHANAIAAATMERLSDGNGILTELAKAPLDDQGSMFKGAFVRGLASLNRNEPQESVTEFLRRNADSAWRQQRVDGGVVVDMWQGGSGNANTGSHASAIDVLVAAAGTV
jgi:predicted alpha-1,6-mannanase (GH76 family)